MYNEPDYTQVQFFDGSHYTVLRASVVRTVRSTPEEDWKTALAHHIQPIPKDTTLLVHGWLDNFYGRFLQVEYQGRNYSVDPKNLEFLSISMQSYTKKFLKSSITTSAELIKAIKGAQKKEELLMLLALIEVDTTPPFSPDVVQKCVTGGISLSKKDATQILRACEEKGFKSTNVLLNETLNKVKKQILGKEAETEELAKYRALFQREPDGTPYISGGRALKALNMVEGDIKEKEGKATYNLVHALTAIQISNQVPLFFPETAVMLLTGLV